MNPGDRVLHSQEGSLGGVGLDGVISAIRKGYLDGVADVHVGCLEAFL